MSVRTTHAVKSVSNVAGPKIVAAGRVNTIGLAERELGELLERLDQHEAASEKAPVRRDFSRWPFRHASVALKIVHPGGTEVELRLACRNLSRGGTSMLHNGYFHPGTTCRVLLPKLAGGFETIPGVICRCSHRRGTLHEIGVKFDKQVDLKHFIASDQPGEVLSLERVPPEKLKGRALLVDNCDMNARIVHHFLRETELVMTRCKTAAEAMAASPASFDVVLVAGALPDMQGMEFVGKLREMGVDSPAMLMSDDPAAVAGAADVGLLVTPLVHDTLLRSLAERLLISAHAADKGKAAASTVSAIGPELLAELQRTGAALRLASGERNAGKALPLCLMIKGAAGAVGHAGLTAAANKAVTAMTANPEGPERFAVVDQLCTVCDAVCATAAQAKQPEQRAQA